MELADADFRALEIRCQHAVEELLAGEYLSVFKGRGIEFEDVRPYAPGDEIRSIDWNVTARTGEPYIKRFIEERDLSVYILVDISASKNFGSQAQTKRQAAAELAGLLAFSAAANHDRVGLMLFSDQLERYLEPGKGRVHVSQIMYEVLNFTPESTGTSLAEPLELLMHVARRRAVVFVISDFHDSGFEDALQAASRLHDIVAVSVVDPHESELPAVGLARLRDAESGEIISVDTGSAAVRSSFAKRAQKRQTEMLGIFDEAGIDHFELGVGDDYVGALHGFLKSRIANRRGNHHG
ncbi:MAG: hypothetical protein ACI8UO_004937 [Verrucomicrobiales bacterium]|jgi:uncharacterized protein (DUF58 family)